MKKTVNVNHRINHLLKASLFSFLSFIIVGCDDSSSQVSQPQPENRIGIWERQGYGDILQVDDSGALLYQYTQTSCLQSEYVDNHELADIFTQASLSEDENELTVRQAENPAFVTQFKRLIQLPEVCSDSQIITAHSPAITFEHFWQTFADHYAFFDKRGVDWQAVYEQYQPLIHENLTEQALFELLSEMLDPLDDGHINLISAFEDFSPEKYKGVTKALLEAFAKQSEYDDIQDYADILSQQYNHNLSNYFDENSEVDSEVFRWGIIDNSVGYLRIRAMVLDEDNSVASNISALTKIMDQAMAALADTQAIVIDLRDNNGGDDAIALAIAGYFIDQPIEVVSKFARTEHQQTPVISASVAPASSVYSNPIAIISASDTASSAEVFLIAMKARSEVFIVGENSNGALSDTLSKGLPNGWQFTLSNEVYLDQAGQSFEVTGIVPDSYVSVFSIASIAKGENVALEAALQILGF